MGYVPIDNIEGKPLDEAYDSYEEAAETWPGFDIVEEEELEDTDDNS